MNDETDTTNDFAAIFGAAASSPAVVSARLAVLDAAASSLVAIADELHVAGWVGRDDRRLATALLSRLAGELAMGIRHLLLAESDYAAGALLRQLIEVEYLLFLGYGDPGTLEQWYRADARTLRHAFSPKAMRKASGGLFRDQEYWLHCEVGGHPHPRARMLLSAYQPTVAPQAFLLPDSVHHVRRAWTSLRLLLPQLDDGEAILIGRGNTLATAVRAWEAVEDATVLSFDGVPKREQ